MTKWRLLAAVAVCVLSAGEASAMPAATFLAKADALMAKGPLALLSSDLDLLKQEAVRAGAELKAERLASVAQHRTTAYCPPVKSGMTSDELLAGLHRIPKPELARLDFKAAMRKVLVQKYPCR